MKQISKVLVFLLLTVNVVCSMVSNDVSFLNVKHEYESNQEIIFQLRNFSDTNYQFFVGTEVYFNNSWHPGITDIDTAAPERGAIMKLLPSHKIVDVFGGPLIFFSVKAKPNGNPRLEITSHRFILYYRLKSNTDFRKIYSTEFIVK